jgi:hypothetical protein
VGGPVRQAAADAAGGGRWLVRDVLGLARTLGSVRVTANPHAIAFYTAVEFVADGTAQTASAPSPHG